MSRSIEEQEMVDAAKAVVAQNLRAPEGTEKFNQERAEWAAWVLNRYQETPKKTPTWKIWLGAVILLWLLASIVQTCT